MVKTGQVIRDRERLLTLAVGLFGLALGLVGAESKSFWYDEAFSAHAIRLSPSELLSLTIHHDPHTGFFHAFLKAWSWIGGESELWLRSFSALCGALAAMILYSIAHRLYGERTAIVASGALALNGFFVMYAQEARPYAFVLLWCCITTRIFISAVDHNDLRRWLLWGVVTALAIYAHPFAAGVTFAQLCSLTVVPRWATRNRDVLAGCLVGAVVVLPWIWMVAVDSNDHLGWVPELSTRSIGYVVHQLTGNGSYVMSAVVALCVGALVASILIRLRRVSNRAELWPDLLTVLWALLLPMLLLVVSLRSSVLVPRYFIPALPGVVLATVVVVSRIGKDQRTGVLRTALAMFLLVSTTASVVDWYSTDRKDDWRNAVSHVLENRQPGDAIVFGRSSRLPFEYYLLRHGVNAGSSPVPLNPERAWGSDMPNREIYRDLAREDEFDAVVSPYRRVWAVYLQPIGMQPGVVDNLRNRYGDPTSEKFPRVVVDLYD